MSQAHAVEPAEPAIESVYNGKLAMWLFLCSEVMFFSGLLGAYITLRTGDPARFEASQTHLHQHMWLAGFNTVLLIASSFMMAMAVVRGQQGDRPKQRIYLVMTALMGILFLVLKIYEYSVHIKDNQVPNTDVFFAFYYALTGVHGFHILCGVIPILGLAWFSKNHDVSKETEMVGLYWHFVDLVWIFLFPLLYLI